eukprot:gene9972-biopygen3757
MSHYDSLSVSDDGVLFDYNQQAVTFVSSSGKAGGKDAGGGKAGGICAGGGKAAGGGKVGGKDAGGGTVLAAKMPVAAQLAAKLAAKMPVAAKLAAKMPVAAKLPGGGKVWRQSLAAWRQSWDRGPPAAELSRTRSATEPESEATGYEAEPPPVSNSSVSSVQFSQSVSQSVSQWLPDDPEAKIGSSSWRQSGGKVLCRWRHQCGWRHSSGGKAAGGGTLAAKLAAKMPVAAKLAAAMPVAARRQSGGKVNLAERW